MSDELVDGAIMDASLAESEMGETVNVMVTRTWKDGKTITKEEDDTDQIEVKPFITQPAKVGFSAGMTLNLGDFESVRLNVFASVPCYIAEMDEAFVAAKRFVDSRLNSEVTSVKDYRKSRKKGE